MREYLDHYDVANEISMRRSVEKGAFVVVEGVTDYRLYGKFAHPEGCRLTIAHSKSNVLQVVREMSKERRDPLVSGIVDADYDRLNGTRQAPPVFCTDTHDLETMIVRSRALDSILWEYGDRERVMEFERKRGMDVRQALLEACYPIGKLMHLSMRRGYELSFRDLELCGFVRVSDLTVDIGQMIDCIHAQSRFAREKRKAIRSAFKEEMANAQDPWQVCRGHDMVDVLLLGFKHIFGGYNSRALGHGSLSGALRLAYDRGEFHGTELSSALGGWGRERGVELWLP